METVCFVIFTLVALYTGAVWSKEILAAVKKAERFLDKNITKTTKRQRRNDLKRKYGFDDSYDKYIA